MVKKSKFRILSYVIEDFLVFYKSINRVEKFIGFCIIKTNNIEDLIKLLQKFLIKRFISYFSIQMSTGVSDHVYFILNFQDNEKEVIIKIFSQIFEEITTNNQNVMFLKGKRLENTFLKIGLKKINPLFELVKKKKTILFNQKKTTRILQILNLNINNITKHQFYTVNFLKLIENLRFKGDLIINIQIDSNNNFKTSCYLVLFLKNLDESEELLHSVNEFYQCELVDMINAEIGLFSHLLWRNSLPNRVINYTELENLLFMKKPLKSVSLSEFNSQFEEELSRKKIKFKRLNKNLVFINQKTLFFIFNTLNLKVVMSLFKKYYSKYFIYILIIDRNDYDRILKIDKINLLDKVKIINREDFLNFNLEVLKIN